MRLQQQPGRMPGSMAPPLCKRVRQWNCRQMRRAGCAWCGAISASACSAPYDCMKVRLEGVLELYGAERSWFEMLVTQRAVLPSSWACWHAGCTQFLCMCITQHSVVRNGELSFHWHFAISRVLSICASCLPWYCHQHLTYVLLAIHW
jgi:hypothetical protein